MPPANSIRVERGPYVGKTKEEMRALLVAAQERLSSGGGTLLGSSVNGQSFQFAAGMSPIAQIRLIQAALAQVDPSFVAPSNQIAVRFNRAS